MMSAYGKKIEFIDSYSHGIFNGNIGFIRYWSTDKHLNVGIFLQNLWEQDVQVCNVILEKSPNEERLVANIPVVNGKGEGSCIIPVEDVKSDEGSKLRFEWAPDRVGQCGITLPDGEEAPPAMVKADKWEQLQEKYPCFFPFEGQGCYVMLQEADRNLLPCVCRNLWESDFYKEAYGRWHHMIVGEYDIEGVKSFYLGLPGRYNEEEQSGAAQAGFMGYEFSGAAGYYLYLLGECL